MRQEIDGAKYDEKVEAAVTEKQNVDKQMVEMADVMKMLTLHSSTRVRLGLKKTEAQAKEAAYNARCGKKKKKKSIKNQYLLFLCRLESKKADMKRILGYEPEPVQAKGKLFSLLKSKKEDVASATDSQQETKMKLSSVQGAIQAEEKRRTQMEAEIKGTAKDEFYFSDGSNLLR